MSEIKKEMVDFYQQLCNSSNPMANDICSLVEPKITPTMVDSFNKAVILGMKLKKLYLNWGLSRRRGLMACSVVVLN